MHNLSFEEWQRAVDNLLLAYVGVSANDLTDYSSYDTWESGASPREGAIACLEEQDGLVPEEVIEQLEALGDE
jgi:hypothetical protein